MRIRADIARLLESGTNLSNRAIAHQVGASLTTVARHREALGIAPHFQGRRQAPPLPTADLWRRQTELVDGGHLRWLGTTTADGVARLVDSGRVYSVPVLAFQERTGQVPQGPVRPECGMDDCVEPRHLEDQLGRDHLAAVAAAIGI
ncbi:hypothetical protein ABZ883_04620 [Streptomyces sp. NPDC046977]|uniref:hypothetical protein n=1 Tax=Streptomyces sp. NPDC046977 TaxID=3154703 RepID=UPI0033E2329E